MILSLLMSVGEIREKIDARKFSDVMRGAFKSDHVIYVLFDDRYNPLYVGYSRLPNERIMAHINGYTNTKFFSHLIGSVGFIASKDGRNALGNIQCDDIEKYVINGIKPTYNIQYKKRATA